MRAVLIAVALIAPTLHAEQVRIYSCNTFEGAGKTPADWIKDFQGMRKQSGILMEAGETAEAFAAFDSEAPPEQVKKIYGDREYADIKDARSLSVETKRCEDSKCTICGMFEGEMVFKKKIADIQVEKDQQPVPAEALQHERFVLPVLSAGLLEGSAWTKRDVEQRLQQLKSLYAGCGIEIERIDIKDIPNPGGKYDRIIDETDIRDSRNIVTNFEREIGKLIESIISQRPAMIYVKEFHSGSISTTNRCMGGAHAFFAKNVPTDSPLIGIAILADSYAPAIAQMKECQSISSEDSGFSLESHELGHLMLDDPGHSKDKNNVMSSPGRPDLRFSPKQCAIIRGSPYLRREGR